MRSRYSAYAIGHTPYLLDTWHLTTRPTSIDLDSSSLRWIGLQVKRFEVVDDSHAMVEFIARYKQRGRPGRVHEISRFVREIDRWFYVDGDQH
jgi:SEC-C motif domain protein